MVHVTLQDCLNAVSYYSGFTEAELKSKSRKRRLVRARWVYIYCARRYTIKSYPAIARTINKDHTTCINGFNQVCYLLYTYKKDQQLNILFNRVKKELNRLVKFCDNMKIGYANDNKSDAHG